MACCLVAVAADGSMAVVVVIVVGVAIGWDGSRMMVD
jgi:hypothetical protein